MTKFPQAEIVTILGALEALYVPLEVREQVPEKAVKVSKLGIFGDDSKIELANALETGRIVSRDIGGSDPERMAAPKYVLLKITLWIKIKTFLTISNLSNFILITGLKITSINIFMDLTLKLKSSKDKACLRTCILALLL